MRSATIESALGKIIEPEAVEIMKIDGRITVATAALFSAAVSTRRIADALERLAPPKGSPA